MNWREYQNQAATFFRQLGLSAEVEFEVKGVRGIHVVDVYASGNFNGIAFTWVVECKAWKTNVPKEKVMALTSIVQDIGADRGFMLSEVGFQSGAIRAAQSSNITLTSIEELSHSTKEFRVGALIGQKTLEVKKAKSRITALKRVSEAMEYHPERLVYFGELSVLEMLLEEALEDKFPIVYPTKGLELSNLDELIYFADQTLELANGWNADES